MPAAVEGGRPHRHPAQAPAPCTEARDLRLTSSKQSTWTWTGTMRLSSSWREKVPIRGSIAVGVQAFNVWCTIICACNSIVCMSLAKVILFKTLCFSFVGIWRAQEEVCTGVRSSEWSVFSLWSIYSMKDNTSVSYVCLGSLPLEIIITVCTETWFYF